MKVELLRMTDRPFELISQAYRICYHSEPYEEAKEKEFISACIKREHTSPLEHCSVTFLVEGISRPTSQQLERHRIASYTQESQRYVNQSTAKMVYPKNMTDFQKTALDASFEIARKTYEVLVNLGMRKEDARLVLPQAIETRLMFTMNFRALRNFLKLRLDEHAQWEIRELAEKCLCLVFEKEPDLVCVFKDIDIYKEIKNNEPYNNEQNH